MTRQRSKPHNFNEQIAAQKGRLEEQAALLPPGPLKDEVLRKVRQLDIASQLKNWLESPGLKSPD